MPEVLNDFFRQLEIFVYRFLNSCFSRAILFESKLFQAIFLNSHFLILTRSKKLFYNLSSERCKAKEQKNMK